MESKLFVHGRRVLIKQPKNTETLSNNLVMKRTVSSRREIVSGIVHLFGHEVQSLLPNDIAFFPKYAAQAIDIDGESYFIVDYKDIELTIRGDES